MVVNVLDSVSDILSLLDKIENLPRQPPSLYCDLEGTNLCRYGTMSLVQLLIYPSDDVYLIDIYRLGHATFITSNSRGSTLKSVLENVHIPKVFFDVRNDSDTLFTHFQIRLQGIEDLQLMEIATRQWSKKRVLGLARCTEQAAQLSDQELRQWKEIKERGRKLFESEHGGTYDVFNIRPIPSEILGYCAQDVIHMPILWASYNKKMSLTWANKVRIATLERLLESQSDSYEPKGKHKIKSPWPGRENPRSRALMNPDKPPNVSLGTQQLVEAVSSVTDRKEAANKAGEETDARVTAASEKIPERWTPYEPIKFKMGTGWRCVEDKLVMLSLAGQSGGLQVLAETPESTSGSKSSSTLQASLDHPNQPPKPKERPAKTRQKSQKSSSSNLPHSAPSQTSLPYCSQTPIPPLQGMNPSSASSLSKPSPATSPPSPSSSTVPDLKKSSPFPPRCQIPSRPIVKSIPTPISETVLTHPPPASTTNWTCDICSRAMHPKQRDARRWPSAR